MRWAVYMLLVVIVLRTGVMYHGWTRIHTNKAIEFANDLRNVAIRLGGY